MSLALLGFSFQTNSLLVFYLIPLVYLLSNGFTEMRGKALRLNLDFLILPFAFFLIKSTIFKPYGPYAGYNEFALGPRTFVRNSFSALKSILVQVLWTSSLTLSKPGLLLIALTGALATWYLAKACDCLPTIQPIRHHRTGLVIGFGLIFLGCFPYLAVGKIPSTVEWETRHQLLLPLGYAFFLYHGLGIFGKRVQGTLLCLLVGIFIQANIFTWNAFLIDWAKQLDTIHAFKALPKLEQARTVLVEDQTFDLNALSRNYRFYEWNAFLKLTFNSESRLGVTADDYQGMVAYKNYTASNYLMSSYKPSPPDSRILLSREAARGFAGTEFYQRLVLDLIKMDQPGLTTGFIQARLTSVPGSFK